MLGFLHVNGKTYELAYPATDQSIENLRTNLNGMGAFFVDVKVKDPEYVYLVGTEGVQASLRVNPATVWASAVYQIAEADPSVYVL